MSELQAGRNESVDYQALERDVERQIAAEQKQTIETPQTPSVSDSKFSSPSSSGSSGEGFVAEAVVHTGLLYMAGPAVAGAAAAFSVLTQVAAASGGKKDKKNPILSQDSKATRKENTAEKTITPGLQTGGQRRAVKTAGPALKAKQGGGLASLVSITDQSMSSLNDGSTKGLNTATAAAKPATLATASHLSSLKQDLGLIRHEQYHGPKIVADSKILSKDATQALRNGNDQVWDNVDRYASNAKYLSTPTSPSVK
ncbi:MAG: hypothetical protein ACQEQL_08780 [Pseudomonadota bacterium]